MYKFIYNRIGLKVSGLLYPLKTALKQVGCSKIKYHAYANMAISNYNTEAKWRKERKVLIIGCKYGNFLLQHWSYVKGRKEKF